MKRRAAKTDANQTKVVEHLRRAGLSVAVTSMVGNGFPDLVVAGIKEAEIVDTYIGRMIISQSINKTVLVELKNPDMPKSGQKLTDAEIKFMDTWKGEYIKATSAEEIIKLFGK